MTAYRSALAPNTTVSAVYYDNDRIKSQTTPDGASIAWSLDPIGRFNTIASTPAGGGTATVKQNHYTDDSDSPAWIGEDTSNPNAITRYVDGIDGQLALATGKSGGRILQLVDLHGDIMGTLPIAEGTNGTATIGSLVLRANDEFGLPLNLTTGGVSANAPPRYGYLGGEQRSAETLGGTLLMGSRVYQPAIGRFTSLDSEPGGNASDYDYVHSDPINNTDLTGNSPDWKSILGVVAKVAEVAAWVPGPVGAAGGLVAAAAYAANGNKAKAIQMGIMGAANLVGCGVVARVGLQAVRAYRTTKAAYKASRSLRVQKMATGAAVHKAFNTALRPLERVGARIDRTINNKSRIRPDARFGRNIFELKPNTASGIKSGKAQLRKYGKVYGKNARTYLITYNSASPAKLWTWRIKRY